MIVQVPRFLNPGRCRAMIDRFEIERGNRRGRAFSTRYELNGRWLDLRTLTANISTEMKQAFQPDLSGKNIVVEFSVCTAMHPGDQHVLHADNCQLDGAKNHTHWRSHTAMLYLNEYAKDFTGGALFFPKFNREIFPEIGLLVMFPSDLDHQHLVTPVVTGTRYALSIWFTQELSRAERWT